MKTIIVLVVVGVLVFSSLKSLLKSFKGEGGCSCSSQKSGSCKIKDKCPSTNFKSKEK